MDKKKQSNRFTPPMKGVSVTDALEGAVSAAEQLNNDQNTQQDSAAYDENVQSRRRKYTPHASTGPGPASWAVDENFWLKEGGKHWTETPTGLATIEFVSRITLGGIFYSWMNNSQSLAAMRQYDPSTYNRANATYLEHISYLIDKTLGTGIKKLHHGIYGDEEKTQKFLRFRENRLDPKPGPPGRSLGAEMTIVTADFAAMSAGSAIMRNTLLGIFNPNERKAWLDKNGKFNAAHILQRTGRKAWEILSYNAGEDMVVALPYVFSLRFIRNSIDKFISPGFKWGSDAVDNGGSVVVNRHGSVMDDLQAAGALDLQARFTIYNVFTQYYRDFYNSIAERWKNDWKQNGFRISIPDLLKEPEKLPERLYQNTMGSLRYLTISTIRSILQMTPTVPFFWGIRVPASKVTGMAVHPEYGVMVNKQGVPVRASQHYLPDGSKHPDYLYHPDFKNAFYWSNLRDGAGNRVKIQYETVDTSGKRVRVNAPNPFGDRKHGPFDPYGFSKPGRRLRHSGTARATDIVGKTIHSIANMEVWQKMSGGFWKLVNPNGSPERHKQLARDAALAGMPYATYFSAKVFFREQYVNEQMNLAISRALDGLVTLNIPEMREGIAEITKTMQGLPFSDPDRQALLIENHRYNPADKSPIPNDWNKELHQKYLEKVAEGKEITTYDLAHILTQRRSNYYFKRADWLNNQLAKGLTREELDSFIEEHTKETPAKADTLKDTEKRYIDRTPQKSAKEEILKDSKPADWMAKRKQEIALAEMESPSTYAH